MFEERRRCCNCHKEVAVTAKRLVWGRVITNKFNVLPYYPDEQHFWAVKQVGIVWFLFFFFFFDWWTDKEQPFERQYTVIFPIFTTEVFQNLGKSYCDLLTWFSSNAEKNPACMNLNVNIIVKEMFWLLIFFKILLRLKLLGNDIQLIHFIILLLI